MKVLICGDRNWDDAVLIKQKLRELQAEHGHCLLVVTDGERGAAEIANAHAKELGIDRCIFPVNREGRGLRAGFVRNELALRIADPDAVFAFHNFLPNSTFTQMLVKQAQSRGVPVRVFKSERLVHA